MILRNIMRRFIYRERAKSDTYIKFLRKKGVHIGEGCTIFFPRNTVIDYQNPYMLDIGNYVRIADGVRILTHDYSFSVMASYNGDIVGSVQKTTIKNNVFIGMNAIILAGVTIGNNVIVGAGSVVTKDCKDNSVYAGNPARYICSIKDLYLKRKSKELENAKKCAQEYYQKEGKKPDKNILREYLMLFSSEPEIPLELDKLMKDTGDYQKSISFYNKKKMFKNIEEFIEYCDLRQKNDNRR